jgi:hypothetical protein
MSNKHINKVNNGAFRMPENNDFKKNSKYKSEIFVETQHLIEEMLKNPEYAKKAIRDRNLIIRGLEADIKHRKVALKEIEARYNETADKNLELTKDVQERDRMIEIINLDLKGKNTELAIKTKELTDVTNQLTVHKTINDNKWDAKIERFAAVLPSWASFFIKLLLTTHLLRIVILLIFVTLLIASFTGWEPILAAIKPFFGLFS